MKIEYIFKNVLLLTIHVGGAKLLMSRYCVYGHNKHVQISECVYVLAEQINSLSGVIHGWSSTARGHWDLSCCLLHVLFIVGFNSELNSQFLFRSHA